MNKLEFVKGVAFHIPAEASNVQRPPLGSQQSYKAMPSCVVLNDWSLQLGKAGMPYGFCQALLKASCLLTGPAAV